jgi:FkbM family methyltransferase
VKRALQGTRDLAVILRRGRDPRLALLAIRDAAARWEMAVMLRAGHQVAVESGRFFVRLDRVIFASSRDEFTTGLWALIHRFVGGEYSDLDVADAVVVDIGAFIGDTALYFAERGAYRVLAYEPFGVNFARARANIELSGAADRISLVNAGVGATSRTLVAAGGNRPSPELTTSPADHGQEVRLLSFADVLAEAVAVAGGRRLVCKLDCEGAEFDILLGAPLPKEFAQVSQVMMETHRRSPDPIKELLEQEGFSVRIHPTTVPTDARLAMLRATRQ